MDNHSLIEGIKNKGGEKELKEVYCLYRDDFILWAARNYSCTIEEAQDIFQHVVVLFYENIVSGKLTVITPKVKTYLFGIGKNKIMELLRKKNKNPAPESSDYFIDSALLYDQHDDHYATEVSKVTKYLNKIGDPCKAILVQFYYHNQSMAEISEKLAYKNSDTVKNLKYKCIQRLKKLFNSGMNTLNVSRA